MPSRQINSGRARGLVMVEARRWCTTAAGALSRLQRPADAVEDLSIRVADRRKRNGARTHQSPVSVPVGGPVANTGWPARSYVMTARNAAVRLTSRAGESRQTSGSLAGLRVCMVLHAGIRWRVSRVAAD